MKLFGKILISILAVSLFFACNSKKTETVEVKKIDAKVKDAKAESAVPAGRQGQTGPFVSEDGRFSIMFSGKPELTKKLIPTDVGDVNMSLFLYQDGDSAFAVSYGDYSKDFIDKSDKKVLLENVKNGQLANLGANPIVDKLENITFEGHPGLYTRAKSPNNLHYVLKLVLKDNRLYQLVAVSSKDYISKEAEESFFGSFKFLKK